MTSELPVSPLTIRLFGGIEVLVQGQLLPKMRSRQESLLLAMLTLAQGRPRERSALAQTLWPFPDHSVDQATRYLRRSLSELRKALGPEAYRLPMQSDHTLLLDLEGAEVDVVAFDSALKQGAVGTLEAAVALYKGPLLHGHTEIWVDEERETYRQRCLRTLRMLSGHAQQRNDFPTQIAWLQRMIALEPMAESIHRMLMEAHTAHGESAAALLVYQELSRHLQRLCNRTPDPLTTALYRRIRDGALSPHAHPPLSVLPLPTPIGYIPHPLTAILGREKETQAVNQSLAKARLVTLTGIGGVGKTRLATHVAHLAATDYPDGVWFIDLADLSNPDLIPERIAGVLEIDLRTKPGQAALRTVLEHLGQRQALLVLDNCEHLHLACAQVATALLAHCGNLRLLTTSRRPLGLMGESRYRVPPLKIPTISKLTGAEGEWKQWETYPVVQLFAERASAIRSDFYLHAGNIGFVVQICAHLDGIPLAIELAAARMDLLTVEQIARRLDSLFSLAAQRGPAVHPRQKTLRALIDWSYDLLAPTEQILLARLSLFCGAWDAVSAQEVCCGEDLSVEEVARGIESLADHSLIGVELGLEQTRYRLLETVRHYGQFRLEQSGQEKAVWARYRDHFFSSVTQMQKRLYGPEQAQAQAWLERENENLRAILARCLKESEGVPALHLAGLLWRFWYVRGYYEEGGDWLARALAIADSPTDSTLLKALTGAGNLAYAASRLEYARSCYTRCLKIQRERGDQYGIAAALSRLANVAQDEGDYTGACTLLESALETLRSLQMGREFAFTLGNLASACALGGDYTRALPLHQESVALLRRMGEKHYVAQGVNLLANTLLSLGELSAAANCLQESLTLSLALESRVDQVHSLICLRKLAVQQQQWGQAAILLGAETALCKAMQFPLSAQDQSSVSAHAAHIQTHIAPDEFHTSYQQGLSMSPAAIADYLGFPSHLSQ